MLRVALFDKDTAEAAVGVDELLGALDFQLHLLRPQKLYDLTAFLPPFALFDGVTGAPPPEVFSLLQATRRLHPEKETEALLVQRQPCARCMQPSCACQAGSPDADPADLLLSLSLDEAALEAAVQQQQQQADVRCCRLRLMLQLLPHRAAKSGKVAWLDELSALLLPAPQETAESALPPLSFPAVWADLQDAHKKLTDGPAGVLAVGLSDTFTWERPVLSLLCLFAFVFLWMHPQFLPSAALLLTGLLLLIVSFIPIPRAAGDAPSGDSDTEEGEAAGSESAAAAPGAAGAWDKGGGTLGGPRGGPPGSLRAFEMVESSDCYEASLLRTLLSAAVPAQVQLHVRRFHHYLRLSVARYAYYHNRLCERREVVVGAIWVMGAWAAVEPLGACRVARYLVLAAGVAVLTCRLYLVGVAVRLLIACFRQLRLYRQRRGRQHLIGIPMV
ncbi:hypothetical protein Efla_001833 [Eimeria flavescens]